MKDIQKNIKSITIGAELSKIQLLILLLNYINNNSKHTKESKDYWTEKAESRLKIAFKEMDTTNKIDMFDCFNHLFRYIKLTEYDLKENIEMEEIAEALKKYIVKCEMLKMETRLKGL